MGRIASMVIDAGQLHNAHVQCAGHLTSGELEVTFYRQIYSVPLIPDPVLLPPFVPRIQFDFVQKFFDMPRRLHDAHVMSWKYVLDLSPHFDVDNTVRLPSPSDRLK